MGVAVQRLTVSMKPTDVASSYACARAGEHWRQKRALLLGALPDEASSRSSPPRVSNKLCNNTSSPNRNEHARLASPSSVAMADAGMAAGHLPHAGQAHAPVLATKAGTPAGMGSRVPGEVNVRGNTNIPSASKPASSTLPHRDAQVQHQRQRQASGYVDAAGHAMPATSSSVQQQMAQAHRGLAPPHTERGIADQSHGLSRPSKRRRRRRHSAPPVYSHPQPDVRSILDHHTYAHHLQVARLHQHQIAHAAAYGGGSASMGMGMGMGMSMGASMPLSQVAMPVGMYAARANHTPSARALALTKEHPYGQRTIVPAEHARFAQEMAAQAQAMRMQAEHQQVVNGAGQWYNPYTLW